MISVSLFKRTSSLLLFGALAYPFPGSSQTPDGAKRPSFEVAAIRPDASGAIQFSIKEQPGGRFVASGVPLHILILIAYGIRDFQLVGGPRWLTSDRWNIEARAEQGTFPDRTNANDPRLTAPMLLMVQSLLEDRFQLKFHRESRRLPVYALTVAKAEPKLKLAEDQSMLRPPGGSRGYMVAKGVDLATLADFLSRQIGETVIDMTGLKGLFEIELRWRPESSGQIGFGVNASPPADVSGPSIFTAIQEQLGLKLVSTKAPVEVLVIDSIQKATEN